MASIRSILATSAISHCRLQIFPQLLQFAVVAPMNGGYHEHLNSFVTIARTGSLTRAASATGTGQSTLSRQLVALEAHLGCKLFHRSTRSIRLTEKGEIFLPHAQRILKAATDARELLHEGTATYPDRLRVACSIAVARRLLLPALPRWQSLHPTLSLDLSISDRIANIVEDQIDVALRAGQLTNSRLIARPIGQTTRIAVASADYLRSRQAPAKPADLTRHDCILYTGASHPQHWSFTSEGREVSIKVSSRLSVSTVDALYDAARAGLGVAVLPSWFCGNALSDGSLVRVLEHFAMPTQTIHAVTLAKAPEGGKIRTFIQFAESLLKDARVALTHPRRPAGPEHRSAPDS
jgi:DNA-binding transcriptional LysR family regulator